MVMVNMAGRATGMEEARSTNPKGSTSQSEKFKIQVTINAAAGATPTRRDLLGVELGAGVRRTVNDSPVRAD